MNWNSNDSREKPLARRGRGNSLTNRQAVTITLVMFVVTTAVFLPALAGFVEQVDPADMEALRQAGGRAERLTRYLVLGGVLVLGCGWMVGRWFLMMSEEVEQ
jgi:hypothetical protein